MAAADWLLSGLGSACCCSGSDHVAVSHVVSVGDERAAPKRFETLDSLKERQGYSRLLDEDIVCNAKLDFDLEAWKLIPNDIQLAPIWHSDSQQEEVHSCGVPGAGVYTGQWQHKRMHGQGFLRFPDGRQYSGQFVHGRRHGVGEHIWPNGAKYTGQWKDGKGHGTGVLRVPDGDIRHGEWREGKVVRWIDNASSLRRVILSPSQERQTHYFAV